MAPTMSAAAVSVITPLPARRDTLEHETLRDFAGVAVAVAVGALLWIAFLSAVRLAV